MMHPRLKRYLASRKALIESALRRVSAESGLLGISVRHSLLGGGKRLRPILVLAAAEACGCDPRRVLPTACAAEMIHTYSLIHDDLPAMDDDDLRRGRPANHKVFGEAFAILAGDALLTRAFELVAQNARIPGVQPEDCLEAVRLLSAAAGPRGMVGGQAADLLAERRPSLPPAARKRARNGSGTRDPRRRILQIHRKKTAALIAGCLGAGAALAGSPEREKRALTGYGRALGLAFQITDDLLDSADGPEALNGGRSDAAQGKLTFPGVHGLESSREASRRYGLAARRALAPLGERAWMLHGLATYVVDRKN